uniref:Nucleoid-associated protein n=1 Tax=Haptolina brevifila TaxID=156173 RepID=A0A7S2J7F4_9EUKA
MDKIKAAQQMFNPEMMKKYSEVGVKVQALQEELAQTEIECASKEGAIVVTVTGTQVPVSVTVTDELCSSGAEAVSSELSNALKQAHAKSGKYAQDKMKEVYEDLGLSAGMAGMGAPPGQ